MELAQLSEKVEQVLIQGNLAQLSPQERVNYYRAVCQSVGLNPLTKPFEYMELQRGKLTLYAKKAATDQLRQLHGVSIWKLEKEMIDGAYIVTAYAKDKDGREDSDMGIVHIANLKGDNLANAMLKAVTKAKRRVTLSLCGLGMLDETEVESIPGAKREPVEVEQVEAETVEAEPVEEAAVRTVPTLSVEKAENLKKIMIEKGIEKPHEFARSIINRTINAFTDLNTREAEMVYQAAMAYTPKPPYETWQNDSDLFKWMSENFEWNHGKHMDNAFQKVSREYNSSLNGEKHSKAELYKHVYLYVMAKQNGEEYTIPHKNQEALFEAEDGTEPWRYWKSDKEAVIWAKAMGRFPEDADIDLEFNDVKQQLTIERPSEMLQTEFTKLFYREFYHYALNPNNFEISFAIDENDTATFESLENAA